jgi:hypothetical protein
LEFEVELSLRGGRSCLLVTRVWLDTEQQVVDFETIVGEPPEFTGNQWRNHLGVRFFLSDASATIQACHFNVLEPFDREQVISPNVLFVQGERANLVFLNEGNEFYLKQGTAISNILVVQNETARRFRYAVGVAAANPLMQARNWYQPVIVATASTDHRDRALSSEMQSGEPTMSLLSFESPDVELLSCRWEDGALRVRLANTSGAPVQTQLASFLPIAEAELTSLDGVHAVRQEVMADGNVALSLRPWDIKQVRLRL